MENSNLKFDTMSIDTLPSYINTLNYTNRKYSKDDIDIETGLIESEVCQICFNIIWDRICLKCPNEKCDSSTDRAICITCSQKIFEKAYKDNIDFKCPFCRTVILKKEEYTLNVINDDEEALVIVYNPRERHLVTYKIVFALFCLFMIYVVITNIIYFN